MDVRAPERTIGANITPFLKLSEVKCSILCFLFGLGDGEGLDEAWRRSIIEWIELYRVRKNTD